MATTIAVPRVGVVWRRRCSWERAVDFVSVKVVGRCVVRISRITKLPIAMFLGLPILLVNRPAQNGTPAPSLLRCRRRARQLPARADNLHVTPPALSSARYPKTVRGHAAVSGPVGRRIFYALCSLGSARAGGGFDQGHRELATTVADDESVFTGARPDHSQARSACRAPLRARRTVRATHARRISTRPIR
jgi:hypothetical protein